MPFLEIWHRHRKRPSTLLRLQYRGGHINAVLVSEHRVLLGRKEGFWVCSRLVGGDLPSGFGNFEGLGLYEEWSYSFSIINPISQVFHFAPCSSTHSLSSDSASATLRCVIECQSREADLRSRQPGESLTGLRFREAYCSCF